MDPTMNNLLIWGIQNSDASRQDPTAPPPQPMSDADRQAMSQWIHESKGPSESDIMDMNLEVIETDPESKNKYAAFRSIETIIQKIDNAHNLENKTRWSKLLKQLESEDPELRSYAAWCCSTAVQNNIRSQERVSHS